MLFCLPVISIIESYLQLRAITNDKSESCYSYQMIINFARFMSLNELTVYVRKSCVSLGIEITIMGVANTRQWIGETRKDDALTVI